MGNKAYVGKTKNPNYRKLDHKHRFKNWNYALIDSVDSLDSKEWKPTESYWIEQFRQWGYLLENKNKGGSGRPAFRTFEEIKQLDKLGSEKYYWTKNKPLLHQWYLENKESKKAYNKMYYQSKKQLSSTL